jgi:hypothetical protein
MVMNVGFQKRQGIWLAEQMLASQERLGLMELVLNEFSVNLITVGTISVFLDHHNLNAGNVLPVCDHLDWHYTFCKFKSRLNVIILSQAVFLGVTAICNLIYNEV